jgi:hypothetical protein
MQFVIASLDAVFLGKTGYLHGALIAAVVATLRLTLGVR